MVEIVIIADDLTGALDTGIKFVKKGLKTQVFISAHFNIEEVCPDTKVIVIDTESRHMTADDAYRAIYQLVQKCMPLSAKKYYKKTDSALRGHIGSEIAALHDALGRQVHFIPAFPDQGRTTIHGRQFIHGLPLADSTFRHDPLNPTHSSNIPDILREETSLSAKCMTADNFTLTDDDIIIYDAVSADDIAHHLAFIENHHLLHALAGCAGFAACIADALGDSHEKASAIPRETDFLCVICGSLTDVSKNQLEYASAHGAKRFSLNTIDKLTKNEAIFSAITDFLQVSALSSGRNVICIDVLTENAVEESIHYARENHIRQEFIPDMIAHRLCEIASHFIESTEDASLFIIGGDTLYAFFEHLNFPNIQLLCEPVAGVVLMEIDCFGKKLQLLSKSGGFGSDDLITKTSQIILKQKGGLSQ